MKSKLVDKLGVFGSILATCACLGVPAIAGALTSLGLGFLQNAAVAIPLLVVSFVLVFAGLTSGWRRHRSAIPLAIASAGAIGIVAAGFVVPSVPASFVALGAIAVASVANAALLRRRRSRPRASGPARPEAAAHA